MKDLWGLCWGGSAALLAASSQKVRGREIRGRDERASRGRDDVPRRNIAGSLLLDNNRVQKQAPSRGKRDRTLNSSHLVLCIVYCTIIKLLPPPP